MPVIRLNNVVLPAPFGPMIALRSPPMMRKETSRVAFKPPKFLATFLSSRTGTSPSFVCWTVTDDLVERWQESAGAFRPRRRRYPLAGFAGREVLVIDR